MLFKLNTHSKIALLIYAGMVIGYLFLPKAVFELGYFGFSLIVIFIPVFVLWRLLKYLHRENNMEYEYLRYDFLVFDLLYMLALPIFYTVVMYQFDRSLWHLKYVGEIYYIGLGIITLLKVLSVNSRRHAGITRFSILFLFPLINLIVINEVYTQWYIWAYQSLGYR